MSTRKIARANMRVGISKQTFLTMGTYLCVVIFHSTSLPAAFAAVIAVFLIQTAGFLILPAVAVRCDKKVLPFLTVFFTGIIAVLIYRIYGLLPVSGILLSALPFPDPSYLLIMVPLLVDQAQSPEKYGIRPAVQQAAIFAGMLITVSFLRELLGFGSIMGNRVIPAGSEPFLLLTHTSGAAFLLLLQIVLALYIYRRLTGKPQVLAALEESSFFTGQPVLDRKKEAERLSTALLSFLILVSVEFILFFLTAWILPSNCSLDIILILAIILQGIAGWVLHIAAGPDNQGISHILKLPWIIPVQTVLLILPFSLEMKSFFAGKGVIHALSGLFIYLAAAWLSTVILLLFARSVRRKLLFGKRPDLLAGIPFLLLIMGLCLMVLTGYSAILYTLMMF